MARLMQTTNAKERVYAQAVSFFSTNDSVLTALKASFTGMFGLHESTQTLEVMKEGMSKSIEVLAEIGDQVGEAAVQGRLRADHPRRRGEEARRFRRHLPGALAGDRQRDAQALDAELGRDPRRGRGRQAPHRPPRRARARRCRAQWLTPTSAPRRRRARPRRSRRPRRRATSTSSCSRWTWSTPCATRTTWSRAS